MARTVDLEILAGFFEEASGYLPQLQRALDALGTDSATLQEAHRQAHCLKGSAAMVGLDELGRVALLLEDALEEVCAGQLAPNAETASVLQQALTWITTYLNEIQRGVPLSVGPTSEVEQAFRQLHGVSEQKGSANNERSEPDPELIAVFAAEAEDHLRGMADRLTGLLQRPGDRELLQEVRRSAHTLKGAAAMVGYRRVTELAHRMEDLLDLLYDGGCPVTPEAIALLVASTDALEDLAASRIDEEVLQGLYARFQNWTDPAAAGPPASKPTPVAVPKEALPAGEIPPLSRPAGPFVRIPLERLDELIRCVAEIAVARSPLEQAIGASARQVEELQACAARLATAASRLDGLQTVTPAGATSDSSAWRSHGFDELEFDRYAPAQLLARELTETAADLQTVGQQLASLRGSLEAHLEGQGRLTSEAQDRLMRLRLVPVDTLASRLQRTVRGVASARAKQIDFILEGGDVRLDKALLENLAEPLLHLLRNAADHGIEPSEVRRERGKPECGIIRVRASHAANLAVIEVSDDGGGIDRAAIRTAAVAFGFLAEADAESLPDADLLDFLFRPGFTTARAVSEVSGRGVGLDVVRASVQRLRGTLSVSSEPGLGTTFTLRVPMNLAVTRALLAQAGGQTFAVPLASVLQVLRPDSDDAAGEQTPPPVILAEAFNLPRAGVEPSRRPPVLVLNAGERSLALVVDRLLGCREVVVKPLGNHLHHVYGIAGATLASDGSVILILNPTDLLRPPPIRQQPAAAAPLPARSHPLTVLVVDDSPSVRRVASNLLRSAGWSAREARDGAEALEQFGVGPPPDLVLLDVEMPSMDGYELLAALKNDPERRSIPVVMVTSRAGDKHRRKALDLGADGYLVKPYQEEELLALIRALARR